MQGFRGLCFGRCMYFIYLLPFDVFVVVVVVAFLVSIHFMIFSTRCFWRCSNVNANTLLSGESVCCCSCWCVLHFDGFRMMLFFLWKKKCTRRDLGVDSEFTLGVHDFKVYIDTNELELSCIVVDVASCNLMTNSKNILIF